MSKSTRSTCHQKYRVPNKTEDVSDSVKDKDQTHKTLDKLNIVCFLLQLSCSQGNI